jgi:O-antigen ligase
MSLYYSLLLFTRFHSDPRLGTPLFNAGFVLVTPVKVVGLFTVLAALVAERPSDAAPRLRNSLPVVFFAFTVIQVLEVLAFRLPIPSTSISSLVSIGLLMVATRALISTEERMRKAVRMMILASAFASLWIYRQHFLQHVFPANGIEQDTNYEALTLVMGIPLAIWMVGYETGTWWKRIGAVCAGLMAGGVLLTESRAGVIAAVVMGLAAVVVTRRKILTLVLIVIAVAIGVVMAPDGLSARFHSIKLEGAATNGDEASSRTHFELMKAGLAMIESYPLTGVGLERFKDNAPYYNRELLQVAGRRYIAHDTYIQIAAETGLPVLILFLALMTVAFMNCRTVRRSANVPLARMATAMQLGLIGFSIAAASVTAEYVTTFWIVVFLSQNLRELAAFAASRVQPQARRANEATARIRALQRRATLARTLPQPAKAAGNTRNDLQAALEELALNE